MPLLLESTDGTVLQIEEESTNGTDGQMMLRKTTSAKGKFGTKDGSELTRGQY